jgi:hypothetical protein
MSTPADALAPASFTDATSRMQQLESMIDQLVTPPAAQPTAASTAATGSATSFQQALNAAGVAQPTAVSTSGTDPGLQTL